MAEKTYDGSSIQILDGLDAVRKRPGMYIGCLLYTSGTYAATFDGIEGNLANSIIYILSLIHI